MRHLRKPTIAERTTIGQDARLIVEAETDAQPTAVRRVSLLVPDGGRVSISIDTPTPEEVGPGRAYRFVRLPSDTVIKIWLQPSQAIYAVTMPGEAGFVELGYICEFFDEEGAP